MDTNTRILSVVVALVGSFILCQRASAEEAWQRVVSDDGKVSVLFPSKPDKIETVSRKSPAGTIHTSRAQYETKDVLLAISGTKLPGVALTFVSTDKLLRNAAEGVLSTYLGKKISQEKIEIGGEPAVVLEYEVPNYDDKDHPGYMGMAIALLVDGSLYVINGIRTRKDPKAKAKQRKLLGSIRVHN